MSQPGSITKYRWKLWYYLLQLLPILANAFLLGYVVYAFTVLAGVMIHNWSLAAVLLIPALLSLVVVGILRLPLLIMRIGNLTASYVVVSPDALVIRLWPRYHFRLCWEDVKLASESRRWGGSGEMLSLKEAEELAEGPVAIRLRKMLRWVTLTEPRLLRLRNVQGYPRGGFADDLRRYAPHLFTAE